MKDLFNNEQIINLKNCEKIRTPEDLQNNSSQIKLTIPADIKPLDKNPQIINIHKTETVVTIK